MLSKALKEVTEYYALTGISKEQVEELTSTKFNELPSEFNDYIQEVINNYNQYCEKMQTEINNHLNNK